MPYANLTNPQTLNLYSMVSDDPESFADLDGHFAFNQGACDGKMLCEQAPGDQKGDTKPAGDNKDGSSTTKDAAAGVGKELKNEARDSYLAVGMMGDPVSLLIGLSMKEESASNSTEKNAMRATFVGMFFIPGGGEEAAGAKAEVFVYRILSKEGKTIYVGITNDLIRRAGEHGVEKLDQIARGLTREQARAVEQALLVRARESGIKLQNKINSVSPKRSLYNGAVAAGKKYLADIGFFF